MNRDGRVAFFRNLTFDKRDKKLINNYMEIKSEIMKEDVDAYINGKIYEIE